MFFKHGFILKLASHSLFPVSLFAGSDYLQKGVKAALSSEYLSRCILFLYGLCSSAIMLRYWFIVHNNKGFAISANRVNKYIQESPIQLFIDLIRWTIYENLTITLIFSANFYHCVYNLFERTPPIEWLTSAAAFTVYATYVCYYLLSAQNLISIKNIKRQFPIVFDLYHTFDTSLYYYVTYATSILLTLAGLWNLSMGMRNENMMLSAKAANRWCSHFELGFTLLIMPTFSTDLLHLKDIRSLTTEQIRFLLFYFGGILGKTMLIPTAPTSDSTVIDFITTLQWHFWVAKNVLPTVVERIFNLKFINVDGEQILSNIRFGAAQLSYLNTLRCIHKIYAWERFSFLHNGLALIARHCKLIMQCIRVFTLLFSLPFMGFIMKYTTALHSFSFAWKGLAYTLYYFYNLYFLWEKNMFIDIFTICFANAQFICIMLSLLI